MVIQTLARAEVALAERFVGVTTDGHVEPGLFGLRETGVSTRPMQAAAEAYLASLTKGDRTVAIFGIDDIVWQRWNNTHPFTMRHGVLLDGLSAPQRERALDLVRTSLSGRGFEGARDIMKLNHTIGELTERWDEYGEWLYWLSILGTPSAEEPWGWQLDGHHLILNCLVLRDQVVMTPMFMGSEPTHAASGKYAGTRAFDAEEQAALAFMRGLSDAQQSTANVQPNEYQHVNEGRIQAGALRDNLQLAYAGLPAAVLSARQQGQLLELIEVYVGRMPSGHDRLRMAEVQQNLDRTHVAWCGGTDPDSTFYYRIHSPVLLIEFDHLRGIALDNDEPARTHIHTVMRTPNGNDYGKDLLRQHYARFAH
ncbi:MAG: DUF3500 domain-containing protein [Chloroflexi bacterium]|nr:DUF3500 domain-containing protein [Chloroflexota bacterium]